MAETLASLKTKIGLVLQDQAGFVSTADNGEMEEAIRQALEQYSLDVPRQVVADITGDGAAYDFDLPAGFVDGLSRIIQIEYPAGGRYPSYLNAYAYDVYRTAESGYLRFISVTPGNGEIARITYTALHMVEGLDDAATTTIPSHSTQAFVSLAASYCLFMLANRFLHEQEASLMADAVDRNSKSDQARRLAGALQSRYRDLVGVVGGEAPAMTTIDWDTSYVGGVSRLTHRGRFG